MKIPGIYLGLLLFCLLSASLTFGQLCAPPFAIGAPFNSFPLPDVSICEGETFELDLNDGVAEGNGNDADYAFFYCNANTPIQLTNGTSGISLNTTTLESIEISPAFYQSMLMGNDPLVLVLFVTQSIPDRRSNEFNLTINPAPDEPSMAPAPSSVCANTQTVVNLNINPTGGDVDILSPNDLPGVVGFVSSANGTFTIDPNDSYPGPFVIRYTVSLEDCTAFTDVVINAIASEEASISGISNGQVFCQNANAVTPQGIPANGDFVLDGIPFSGSLDFGSLSPGSHTLIYTSPDLVCPSEAQVVFTVTAPPNAAITSPMNNLLFCEGGPEVPITVAQAGGTLSINNGGGANVNSIDPSALQPNSYTLTYSISSGSCSNSSSINFTIAEKPVAIISPNGGIYCGSVDVNLESAGSTGQGTLTYEWTGGSMGNPLTDSTIDPSPFSTNSTTSLQNVNFQLILEDDNECVSDPAEVSFQVLPVISGVESLFDEVFLCDGDAFELEFSNNNSFDPTISGVQVSSLSTANVDGLPGPGSETPLNSGFSGNVTLNPDNLPSIAEIVFTPYTFLNETTCLGGAMEPVQIEVRPLPATGDISGQTEYCFGEDIIISSGLLEDVDLNWQYNPNGLVEVNSSDEQLSLNLESNPTGDFEVAISYSVSLNGCASSSDELGITVYSRPILDSGFSFDPAICEGSSLGLNCDELIQANTGSQPFNCTVSTSSPGILSTELLGLQAGTSNITIQVEDLNGCAISTAFTQAVEVVDIPSITSPDPIQDLCVGVEFTIGDQLSLSGEYDLIIWDYSEDGIGEQTTDALPFTFLVTSEEGTGQLTVQLENIYSDDLSCFSNVLFLDVPTIPNVAFAGNQEIFVCENEEGSLVVNPGWNLTSPGEGDTPISWNLDPTLNAVEDMNDFSLEILPPFTNGAVGEISGALQGCDLSTMEFELIVLDAPATEILNAVPQPCNGHEVVYSASVIDSDTYSYSWDLDCTDCTSNHPSESAIFIAWSNTTGVEQSAALSLLQEITYEEANNLQCSRSQTIDFTISPNSVSCPQGLIYLPPNLLFAEDPLADHFQWYTVNGDTWEEIPGALDSPYWAPPINIVSCADGAQQYGVGAWQSDMDECEVRFNFCFEENMTDCVTEITEIEAGQLLIYPNPSHNGNIFVSQENQNQRIEEIWIYNSFGQEVYRKSFTDASGQIQLDLSSLSNGVYQLLVQSNSSKNSEQVVIMH